MERTWGADEAIVRAFEVDKAGILRVATVGSSVGRVVKMRRCCGEKLRESARTRRELCDELQTTMRSTYTNNVFVARETAIYMSWLHRDYPKMRNASQYPRDTRAVAVQIDRRTQQCSLPHQETLQKAGQERSSGS